MNGLSGVFLFYSCATLAVGAAAGTVFARDPLRAAMSLLVHIIALAGLYLTLSAHFLAAIQLLVYAGAVVVLFVFVIMLLGPQMPTPRNPRNIGVRVLAMSLVAVLTGGAAFTVVEVTSVLPKLPRCGPAYGAECGQFGGVGAVGRVLYTGAVVPFELVSILLLVAIIGAVAVARGRTAEEAEAVKLERIKREAENTAREEAARKLSAEVAAHGGH